MTKSKKIKHAKHSHKEGKSYDGLKLQDLEILWAIFAFLKKATPMVKSSKFCSASPINFVFKCC